MVATLRVMLDQLVAPTDPDLAEASRELARGLVLATPSGCEVEAVIPAGGAEFDSVSGLSAVRRAALPRREMATALQMGLGTGIGAGMVHSPSLFAPLVRHDRVHDNDQTVVTLWDLHAWETPDELPRGLPSWQKAMLKRAVKYADAVVVPTHSLSERLREIAPKLGDRVRVIAGASPQGFAVPTDEIGRRRGLDLPEGYLLLAGGPAPSHALETALAGIAASGVDLPIVVIDVADGQEPAVADVAAAAGIPERRLHVRGALEVVDRAAVYGSALAFVAPARRAGFPWRVVDALTLGVPVIASDSAVHRDVIVDGGVLVDGVEAFAAAVSEALGTTRAADRLAVLSGDRGKVFSWRESADKVWMLHADL